MRLGVVLLLVGAACLACGPDRPAAVASQPAATAVPSVSAVQAPTPTAPAASSTPEATLTPEATPATESPPAEATPARPDQVGRATSPNAGYSIEIPRLAVNLPVIEGDVARDVVQERTPEHAAFHLPGTSFFGAGNTYIYAHARPGMFLNLWNARIGDRVIVRTPLGTREYVVAEIHPRVPPTQTSWAQPTADTRLTLQTSTGPNSGDPRFVVVARP